MKQKEELNKPGNAVPSQINKINLKAELILVYPPSVILQFHQ